MAYVVRNRNRAWELRESAQTARGPRSRTLATFHILAPATVEHARERATAPLSAAAIRAAARRAGAPVAPAPVDGAAAALLAELALGRRARPALSRVLRDALAREDARPPSDAERAAAPWAAATPERRAEALRDLLLLADRLPRLRARAGLRFPRIASREGELT